MAFQDVGVEVFNFPAADRLDEVAEVVLAAAKPLDDLAIGPVGDAARVAGTDEDAFGAVKDVAHEGGRLQAVLGRFLEGRIGALRPQATDLENQLTIAVVE